MGGSARVAVVTGASSGIGKATAAALARQGWRVIGVGRDPARSAAAADELGIEMLTGDLSRLREAERIAHEVAARTDRVDVLVNNAGGMARAQAITEEGLEENFTANHLGPFLLTERLLPLLRAAAADSPAGSVRIVNTASDASEMVPGLDFADLQSLDGWNPGLSYCRSKLANVMVARGLATRLAADGIVAHSMHPGVVDTNFVTHAPAQAQAHIATLTARTAEDGADTVVWLATDAEAGRSSGGYWSDRAPRALPAAAQDAVSIDRLWSGSEALIARTLS